MLFWSIQISITSIFLIILVHYLINYFKSMLTVPQIKDLVNTSNKNYEKIYETLKNESKKNQLQKNDSQKNDSQKNDSLINDHMNNDHMNNNFINNDFMKNELKKFINQTTSTGIPGTTAISKDVQGMSNEKDWGMNFNDENSSKKKISFLKESLLS